MPPSRGVHCPDLFRVVPGRPAGPLYDRHDDHVRPPAKAKTATEAATGIRDGYRHAPQARTKAGGR
jgi:hypothetical protein